MRNGYTRLKPDRPRKSKDDGKPIKYESPKGSTNRAYFPPHTLAALPDPTKPLIVVEGEKKAAKADQEGFPTLGLVGVWGWHRKRENKDAPRELIPDLEAIAWGGRTVFLCYDSDLAEKKNVAFAEWHLAEALTAKGATVKVVRLPPGPEGAKVGSELPFIVDQIVTLSDFDFDAASNTWTHNFAKGAVPTARSSRSWARRSWGRGCASTRWNCADS